MTVRSGTRQGRAARAGRPDVLRERSRVAAGALRAPIGVPQAACSPLPPILLTVHISEPELLVLARGRLDPLRRAPVELFLDLRGRPRRQDFGRYLIVLVHHAPRRQHDAPSYASPVEDDAPHADDRLVFDNAPLQQRKVPDGDVLAD